MVEYTVKSWKHFFQAIKKGNKLHDLRDLRDRQYKVGDVLNLREYDFEKGVYTGDSLKVQITYITSADTPCAFSSSALGKDYCILSITKL